MISGQGQNPRGKDHLRRVQALLNSKYRREDDAVAVLDWARKRRKDNGDLFTDREIVREALIALWEKEELRFEALVDVPTASNELDAEALALSISEVLLHELDAHLSRMNLQSVAPGQREKIRKQVKTSINSAITTANLTGESYKFQDDEE